MITREILQLISQKLHSIIFSLVMIGLSFFVLAAAILFYPQLLQIVFILVFFLLSFWAFLIAVKISSIKDHFERTLTFLPKSGKKK